MSRIEQKRRELFEAWAKREWPSAPLHYVRDALPMNDPRYGEYCDESLQRAWVGWQAALDAVVIDIRKDYFPGSDNMGAIVLDKNYSRFAFLRIIEDIGLGIKVKS